jgi:hypothetical protein
MAHGAKSLEYWIVQEAHFAQPRYTFPTHPSSSSPQIQSSNRVQRGGRSNSFPVSYFPSLDSNGQQLPTTSGNHVSRGLFFVLLGFNMSESGNWTDIGSMQGSINACTTDAQGSIFRRKALDQDLILLFVIMSHYQISEAGHMRETGCETL